MSKLHKADREGDTEEVRKLIAAGEDLNAKDGDKRTPLHFACIPSRSADAARILIAVGSEVNAKDGEQDTPPHLACFGGHTETERVLITAGADLNAKGDDQDTPLMIAERQGSVEMAKMLKEAIELMRAIYLKNVLDYQNTRSTLGVQ